MLEKVIMKTNEKVAVFFTLAIVLLNLFYHLNSHPIMEWDEARHMASAIEMTINKQYLVNYYQGHPDYWNAKPVLAFWGQMLGFWLVPDVWGLRLISVLAAIGTVGLIILYTQKHSGLWVALLAVLIYISTPKLLYFHGARSADADMLFGFFIFLAFYLATRQKRWLYYLAFFVLGLAFLTKSFHAVPFAIATFIYGVWLYRSQKIPLTVLLIAPFCFWLPILPWAMMRYTIDGEKFFHTMIYYDLLKRSVSGVESHQAPWWDYSYFMAKTYSVFILVAVGGWLRVGCHQLRADQLTQMPALLLLSGVPFLLYSMATSKLVWYIYPILPLLAIILAILIGRCWQQAPRKPVVIALVVMLLFNEYQVIHRINKDEREIDVHLTAIQQLSHTDKALKYVFLACCEQIPQHYYAQALIMGNVSLQQGGELAFQQSSQSPKYLLAKDGQIRRID